MILKKASQVLPKQSVLVCSLISVGSKMKHVYFSAVLHVFQVQFVFAQR